MPIYAVDKPLNFTSHDVVARARKLLKTRKIGHTGTLDPLATGVLVLCVEDSTKLVQFMESDSKDYLAFIAVGAATLTLDAEGPITETSPAELPETDKIQEVLNTFLGPQQQIPPQFSAIQVGGVRAYDIARQGGTLELPARNITLFELTLLGTTTTRDMEQLRFQPSDAGWGLADTGQTFTFPEQLGDFPVLVVRCSVSSGSYIRALARDVGLALGTSAHLAGLVRTRAGKYHLQDCVTLDELPEATGYSEVTALDLPVLDVDAELARRLRSGQKIRHDQEGRFVILHEGALVAVAEVTEGVLRVLRVWH
ncbi:tRNA pseudouridine(55) synthase TruB [Deinococcus cellulosilyticus]|uniref:tRNA pseudouridine synthase B n=1 Tax=Deinococcus cellulosilyticus (strain DSM 18568 / NBRC 106333 / KACC 11606 / 5516J-15) TaxID=1223518 RepID=A0A511MX02_DEIC1|nr:tRNA pseudouridine(55) synthase TruB [Deinococcus cellulosilyticus]GEM45099.1 tRNA pseudouridine synthase B [Deinococcus cellulosilyticus NBRC 106333 = KACC 11606]